MKNLIQQPLGHRIREFRKRQSITQEELAMWLQSPHTPVTHQMIANWEIGRGDVPAGCIQLLAYSLGVKVADILPDLTLKELISQQLMKPPGKFRRCRTQTEPSTGASL